MILIDKPFVSDFLIDTIKKNNFEIIATKEAKELILDTNLNWVSEEDAIYTISNNPNERIYTNSENSITWIFKNFKDSKLSKQIQLFKDKGAFRVFVKEVFPEFFFKIIEFDTIQDLSLEGIDFPFVIKPSLGFFSLGVHIVHNLEDWNSAKKELKYENFKGLYPKEVLDTSTFIIEEYIEGEEYAVDCYFDNMGKAVILNILHHKFSSGTDVSDRVYSTSRDIINMYKNDLELFLQPIGDKAELKNFPIHIEVRIDAANKITPIEVNPLRFGGWCTTGDLAFNAYGFNSYEYFLKNIKPDWNQIFNTREDKIYSIVLLNNTSGFELSEITSFNYDLLIQDFENVLVMRKMDIQKAPVFGLMFTETSLENKVELDTILTSDLKRYVETNL